VKKLKWASNDKPARFDQLSDALVALMSELYPEVDFEDAKPDPTWRGPSLGMREAAIAVDPEKRFSKDYLEWLLESQNRTALGAVIDLALQLGIEQGRRLETSDRVGAFLEAHRGDSLRALLTRIKDVHPEDLPSSLRDLRLKWLDNGAPGLRP
jgi:hypothetical protein